MVELILDEETRETRVGLVRPLTTRLLFDLCYKPIWMY